MKRVHRMAVSSAAGCRGAGFGVAGCDVAGRAGPPCAASVYLPRAFASANPAPRLLEVSGSAAGGMGLEP